MTRLHKHIAALPEMAPTALLELRYDLLLLSTEVPRPRDRNGRFIRRVS